MAFFLPTRGILNKPEYWFQPRQLLRKMHFALAGFPSSATAKVRLPWGIEFDLSSGDTIGKSLFTYGVYELAVSEVLWRLTDPGDRCLDIGANIGYMTSLLAVRASHGGRVYSFEPHPDLFLQLRRNLNHAYDGRTKRKHAPVSLMQLALGANDGVADLVEPEGFKDNQGTASIVNTTQAHAADGVKHRVEIKRLDTLFHDVGRIGIAKIDVEGAELPVLQGAEEMLAGRKIRDIVFEDFQSFPSGCVRLLQNHAYSIYRLAKAVLGPVIWEPSKARAVNRSLRWEPVNYLATLDPNRAEGRLRARGWRCLRAKE
jgi:FkbM family methyltransferase